MGCALPTLARRSAEIIAPGAQRSSQRLHRTHPKHPSWGLRKVELGCRFEDLREALGTLVARALGGAREPSQTVHFPEEPLPASRGEMAARAPAPRLLLCLWALLTLGVAAGSKAVIIGEVHENVTLHCGNISGPRGLVTWYRNDSKPVFLLSSNSSLLPAKPRFSLTRASSLHIEALSLQDAGNYTCLEVLKETRWFRVRLQVASGPYRVEVNITTTGLLPNGTLYVAKGSQVDFSCSSRSWPPPMVEWWFQGPDSRTEPFGNNLTVSRFSLLLMSQNLQGNYTCLAMNMLSGRRRKVTTELLVYSPPLSALQCWVEMVPGLFLMQLICRWDGGYPDPNFLWTEEPGNVVLGLSELGVELLNRSQMSDGKKFKCVGIHILKPEAEDSCVIQIRSPSVDSEPMKTCLVGGNVTLTCHVSGAYPQAKILWLRNLTQPEMVIQPNSHYLITQKGQRSTLTIRNCSHNLHEGYYICRAENPIGMREVNIWLTVKKPLNIVGIVGTTVSLLLLGLAVISGLTLYYSPGFCWKGNTFRDQDMGDVMVLVDSEEEEVEEEENAEEEEKIVAEEEANEREELPKEIHKHGHIHRVTALVNGNMEEMGYGLQALQDEDDIIEQQSDIFQEEGRPA